jgi:hypothetical protein
MPTKATRRGFLKLGVAAASVSAAELAHALPAGRRILIVVDEQSPVTDSAPVQWALSKLRDAITPDRLATEASGADFRIVVASANSGLPGQFDLRNTLSSPETMALVPSKSEPAVLATGSDARGIAYAVLELADRIRSTPDTVAALRMSEAYVETSPNRIRSVARAFVSEIEDKLWFYNRDFWTSYLDAIAAARFNRFNFALGFGWDFPRGVTGDYLHFPYPYLVELPGYEQVHVEPELAPFERQRNLDTLQFIAAETARRGMDFQLGIWTHAYEWTDSPHSDHRIVGLTPQTHAAYCRDALAGLLKACPQITGLTMRIHGESGIPEGSYPFWQTLFQAISNARTPEGGRRRIEIDLHAKGLDDRMIAIARATGMPVTAGAKFWAEHQGLAYHQADIRAAEYPRTGVTGTFALSSGARNFTRYGYGDFYKQDFGVGVLYRVWPGTQRHLLWGDAALASGYGRAAHFCGAEGMELCEPLTFKGREGSGHPGGRDAYADPGCGPDDLDSHKFELTYALWGRYLYNPDTAPEFLHRALKISFGPAGPALETALANSSRILPLITTAWLPSASNHEYWPEMFTPLSLLPIVGKPLYGDSPAPHNVSAISPLDPQLFSTIDQHAKDLLGGVVNARYSPAEVSLWLEGFSSTSTRALEAARKAAKPDARTPEFRRADEDIRILNGLGMYYAHLFRAGLLYSIHEQSGDPAAATACLISYQKARDAWAAMSNRAKSVYETDITYGSPAFRRGHWADRLPAMDADFAAVQAHFAAAGQGQHSSAVAAIQQVTQPAARAAVSARHAPAEAFLPGSDLPLSVSVPATVEQVLLWYRHVNHAERWMSVPMQRAGTSFAAAIPGAYTSSAYPLQYYFELRTASAATLHPLFNATLSNQPYFAVHKRG